MKKEIQEICDKYGVMRLLGSDGCCGCGECEIFGLKIDVNCHKSNGHYYESHSCDCPYSCVHIQKGEDIMMDKKELREIAQIFADYLSEAYRTEVKIVIE